MPPGFDRIETEARARVAKALARGTAFVNLSASREGAAAMAEYQAARRALIENTARLREARLAREAAEQAAVVEARKVAPAKKVRVAGRQK